MWPTEFFQWLALYSLGDSCPSLAPQSGGDGIGTAPAPLEALSYMLHRSSFGIMDDVMFLPNGPYGESWRKDSARITAKTILHWFQRKFAQRWRPVRPTCRGLHTVWSEICYLRLLCWRLWFVILFVSEWEVLNDCSTVSSSLVLRMTMWIVELTCII